MLRVSSVTVNVTKGLASGTPVSGLLCHLLVTDLRQFNPSKLLVFFFFIYQIDLYVTNVFIVSNE